MLRKPHARSAALALAALPLLLPACLLLRDVETPEVELAGISRVGGNLLQQELRLDLRVRNPNEFELDVRGLDFDLELGGQPVATGHSDQAVVLPALGEAQMPVEIRATLLDVLGQALGALGNEGAIPYRVRGHVLLGHRFTPRLPFEKSGDVALFE